MTKHEDINHWLDYMADDQQWPRPLTPALRASEKAAEQLLTALLGPLPAVTNYM
jgi:hypothetical protein